MHLFQNTRNADQQAFLPLPRSEDDIPFSEKSHWKQHKIASYLRFSLEIAMALAIIALLVHPLSPFPLRKQLRLSPVPDFPMKAYTFLPNSTYLHENMFSSRLETLHTLHNWIPLSSDGRGMVQIADMDKFDLGEPYGINMNDTYTAPVYMMSVFHQLHCLVTPPSPISLRPLTSQSYLAENYQTVPLPQDIAFHSAHCFDYLRQSIMCAADTSLEGETEAGPGWGSTHQCKDYEMVRQWANERTVFRWRNLMPDVAVL
ncbi:hypothetical protein B7494_g8340 [Chlorociboria aeruginascens]|nr:hypothetical protein B7494_g8340 [Chlorociboria aeruginascens]